MSQFHACSISIHAQRLEELFETEGTDESSVAASRLLSTVLDAFISLGKTIRLVRTENVEEDHQTHERGRRLVAELKKTSMVVQECHLVAKSVASCESDIRAQGEVDRQITHFYGRDEEDIELGRVSHNQNNGTTKAGLGVDDLTNSCKNEQSGLELESGDGNNPATRSMKDQLSDSRQSTGRCEVSTDSSNKQSTTATASDKPTSNPLAATCLKRDHSQHSEKRKEEKDSCNIEDDDKYMELCLAVTDSSEADTFPQQCTLPEEKHVVEASCAICLGNYRPGCVVSWSLNGGCTHVFHRDCIFMWLWKKERWECPCCRGMFVSEAASDGKMNKLADNKEISVLRTLRPNAVQLEHP